MSGGDLTLGRSPFDAIMLPGERWSARALMPLLGYGADWRNFAAALDRAKTTAKNQGFDAATLFVGTTENTGGRPREDFTLTRFACYLVAMNGDPRKSEVAAAQAYFAIKTREAEVAPAVSALPDRKALARMVIEAEEAREIAEARVAALEPKAQAFDNFLNGEGAYLIGTVARILGVGQTTMFRFLYDENVLISSGPRKRQPYANPKFDGWFRVKTHDQENTNGHASATTYVTPRGAEGIRLLAIEKGLIEPQLIGLPGMKEIGA